MGCGRRNCSRRETKLDTPTKQCSERWGVQFKAIDRILPPPMGSCAHPLSTRVVPFALSSPGGAAGSLHGSCSRPTPQPRRESGQGRPAITRGYIGAGCAASSRLPRTRLSPAGIRLALGRRRGRARTSVAEP
eukprot:scaffold1880_cov115-Isochrysis_galbana.AAC.9